MRAKRANHYFYFLYPGLHPGTVPEKDAPQIAIPKTGEFVSITGSRDGMSAVFNSPQELRDLADCLYEAADLYAEAIENRRQRK